MKTKVLMINPKVPETFWNHNYIMPYLDKKTMFPPLGLLTVAALMPENYDIKIIDMNAEKLKTKYIAEADLIFITAMAIQLKSFNEVVNLCKKYKKTIVAGGSLIWSAHDFSDVIDKDKIDHFIYNEAEINLPKFLKDYEKGQARKVYSDDTKADITKTPIPRFDLMDLTQYFLIPMQFSRGCPFNCEFCDIIEMVGRKVRTKTPEQFIEELETVYKSSFNGQLIFIVDDNFIGDINKTKALLRKVIEWQKSHKDPFYFMTQVSMNIAKDEELMDLMEQAGFFAVFIGIESPDTETLKSIHKLQNTRADMVESVRKIQTKRMMVAGGFIIGFDNDTEKSFDMEVDFIQKAGIPMAMAGMLVAMPNTQLFHRLKKENRIIGNGWHSGDNVGVCLNFIPKLPEKTLIEGYKYIISELYSAKNYFERILVMLKYLPKNMPDRDIQPFRENVTALQKTRIILGIIALFFRNLFSSRGLEFMRFMKDAYKVNPVYCLAGISLATAAVHYFKLAEKIVNSKDYHWQKN